MIFIWESLQRGPSSFPHSPYVKITSHSSHGPGVRSQRWTKKLLFEVGQLGQGMVNRKPAWRFQIQWFFLNELWMNMDDCGWQVSIKHRIYYIYLDTLSMIIQSGCSNLPICLTGKRGVWSFSRPGVFGADIAQRTVLCESVCSADEYHAL